LATIPNVSVDNTTMTFVGKIVPAKQGPDGDAVDYATITIKVPVNRVGSVFGCMRNLHRQDKRLSKISYRKHTKVSYAKCAGPSSSSSESSMSDESESSTTDTDTSESSISEMIRAEVSKFLSENNYSKVVPPAENKPTSINDENPQLVIQSGAKLCECTGFQAAMNMAKEFVTDSRTVLYDQVNWAINRAKYETTKKVFTTKLGMPCNLVVQDRTIICTGQCKAVTARKVAESRKAKARRVEESRKEVDAYEEERYKDRAHKSYIKQMKTDIPSKEEVNASLKSFRDAVSIRTSTGWTQDTAKVNALRCYRINGKFYNANEFMDRYHGMGWFRKQQWKTNNN